MPTTLLLLGIANVLCVPLFFSISVPSPPPPGPILFQSLTALPIIALTVTALRITALRTTALSITALLMLTLFVVDLIITYQFSRHVALFYEYSANPEN